MTANLFTRMKSCSQACVNSVIVAQRPLHAEFFDVLTMDLDFARVFPRNGQVVGKLNPKPRLLRAAERLCQADCHLWTNAGFSGDDVVKRLPGDAENFGALGNREPQRLKARAPDDSAGMRWIFHGHGVFV